MYKCIVVAYDGSEFSAVALKQGADLARLCGAKLHLVGIVSIRTFVTMGAVGYADIWGMEREDIDKALKAAVKTLADTGVEPTTSMREGSPAVEIAACAREQRADLVVIGHTGKGVLARWFEGSVGAGLINELQCNLLIATT